LLHDKHGANPPSPYASMAISQICPLDMIHTSLLPAPPLPGLRKSSAQTLRPHVPCSTDSRKLRRESCTVLRTSDDSHLHSLRDLHSISTIGHAPHSSDTVSTGADSQYLRPGLTTNNQREDSLHWLAEFNRDSEDLLEKRCMWRGPCTAPC
jgi:hypothetical protein